MALPPNTLNFPKMKNILQEILHHKREEVDNLKKTVSLTTLEQKELFSRPTRSISEAIVNKKFGIIAEIKRKSPSAGHIRQELNILNLMRSYEESGAVAISCLTDKPYFDGTIDDLEAVARNSKVPVLRKEFIIDEFQIYESKAYGADAILLICEALTKEEILDFTILAQSLGMEVLLELHHISELSKINQHVNLIGINNRDLKAQRTDISRSLELITHLPESKVRISESGIKTAEELEILYRSGFQGALIGESILKSQDPQNFLASLNIDLCS